MFFSTNIYIYIYICDGGAFCVIHFGGSGLFILFGFRYFINVVKKYLRVFVSVAYLIVSFGLGR